MSESVNGGLQDDALLLDVVDETSTSSIRSRKRAESTPPPLLKDISFIFPSFFNPIDAETVKTSPACGSQSVSVTNQRDMEGIPFYVHWIVDSNDPGQGSESPQVKLDTPNELNYMQLANVCQEEVKKVKRPSEGYWEAIDKNGDAYLRYTQTKTK